MSALRQLQRPRSVQNAKSEAKCQFLNRMQREDMRTRVSGIVESCDDHSPDSIPAWPRAEQLLGTSL